MAFEELHCSGIIRGCQSMLDGVGRKSGLLVPLTGALVKQGDMLFGEAALLAAQKVGK